MKIWQLFKPSKPTQNMPIEYIPVLWEDDYCQIEILPVANLNFVRQQVIETNQFSEGHKTESGYTDVFIRREAPVEGYEIIPEALAKCLTSSQLPEFEKIRYQFQDIIFCKTGSTKAFGFSCCTLFFDTKDGFVKNIWAVFNFGIQEEYDIMVSALYDLGETYKLFMIDWNSDEIIDLTNKSEIRAYLSGWQKDAKTIQK